MRFAFFGTDDFSTLVLDELKSAGFLPSFIITTPDRPKGRGFTLTPPPVKVWAQKNGLKFLQPEKLDSVFNLQLTRLYRDSYLRVARKQAGGQATYDLQLFIAASYGLIIPRTILDIPLYGTLNIHPSLLPKYRGATPIESQILAGEKNIGVTVMLMDEKVDHGPIVAQRQIFNPLSLIFDKESGDIPRAAELKKILAEEGGKLLAEAMPKWISGQIKAAPQDHSQATYTRKFAKSDGEIDLDADPRKNYLKILAFDGSIGTYCYADKMRAVRGQTRLKKTRVIIADAKYEKEKLILTRVIPEGKKEMSYEDFLRGIKCSS